MSEITIYDVNGKSYPAVLVDGIPKVESDEYLNFLFPVKVKLADSTIIWLLRVDYIGWMAQR